jgi:hypothetical protein
MSLHLRRLTMAAAVALLAGCALPSPSADDESDRTERGAVDQVPDRFTIVPDDYHVPYAGTAEDGRKFFLSDELFVPAEDGAAYVGLFLWKADGSFDEVRVDRVDRDGSLPPGQAGPTGADDVVRKRLAQLGDYTLEAIQVEPFTQDVDGVTFGWRVTRYDGTVNINIEPGDFIAYYAPWDGLTYDT